jgi:hypothetical protein
MALETAENVPEWEYLDDCLECFGSGQARLKNGGFTWCRSCGGTGMRNGYDFGRKGWWMVRRHWFEAVSNF